MEHRMAPYDAILVPGGGVRAGGRLPSWVERRLERAVERHRGEYILALSAGTTHRPPPVDERGFPIFESVAAARYLIAAGVAPERILTETHSYDTVGNAYFSRVIHAEPAGLRRLLVITSDFHLPRARAVFEWMYRLEPRPSGYLLEFEAVTDSAMPPDLLAARSARERASLERFGEIAGRIATLRECHHWLFTAHGAYDSAASAFGRATVDSGTAESY
jgi:hypothetical protein